jgi:hypothetical protein
MNRTDSSSVRIALAAGAGMIALQAAVLFSFGQPPIHTCGDVKLREGVAAILKVRRVGRLIRFFGFSGVLAGS